MWKKIIADIIFSGARHIRRAGYGSVELTKDVFEKGKAMRRIILLFSSIVWLWLLRVCVAMYMEHGALDVNFTYLCIAVTTMLGSCYAFYFAGRTTEITSSGGYNYNNIYMPPQMGNNIPDTTMQGEEYLDHNVNP